MAEGKLRAAVIGAGVGGGHGYAYARAPEYEFVAVCDINPEVLARAFTSGPRLSEAPSPNTRITARCWSGNASTW